MLFGKRVLVAVAAVVGLLAVSTAAANASTNNQGVRGRTTAAAQVSVETRVQGLLRNNPGSHRVGPSSVEVTKGHVVTACTPPQCSGPWDSKCAVYNLCLFQHADWGGYKHSFYYCGNYNLYNIRMDDGRTFNDQVSSVENAQIGSSAVSRLYDYRGSGDPMNFNNDDLIITLAPGHWLRNLSQDSAEHGGGNANDRIDVVHVC
jgi:hypothetical protein